MGNLTQAIRHRAAMAARVAAESARLARAQEDADKLAEEATAAAAAEDAGEPHEAVALNRARQDADARAGAAVRAVGRVRRALEESQGDLRRASADVSDAAAAVVASEIRAKLQELQRIGEQYMQTFTTLLGAHSACRSALTEREWMPLGLVGELHTPASVGFAIDRTVDTPPWPDNRAARAAAAAAEERWRKRLGELTRDPAPAESASAAA